MFKDIARQAAELAHPRWRDARYSNVISSPPVIRNTGQDGDQ